MAKAQDSSSSHRHRVLNVTGERVFVPCALVVSLFLAGGCAANKSNDTGPAAADSVADRCERAVNVLRAYVEVTADPTRPPVELEKAAATATSELRILAEGLTDKRVLAQMNASIGVLGHHALGDFGPGIPVLPTVELVDACRLAIPK
jgi:archaellum component FlaG (FlaF/FlaG flagellin family)